MKLVPNQCTVCGGVLKDFGTYYKCESCDAEFRVDEGMTQEEADTYFRRLNDFEDAERNLSVSPPKFDRAESEYELIVRKYPDWSAGYWGLVRAKFGIKFERDSDGKAVPSCYKSTYEDFRNTKEYEKAFKYAETEELRQTYQKMAEYIARVAKDWREEAQKYDYDVFISFKASDEEGGETSDSREMQNLYTYLTGEGFRVFFSPVTLRAEGYGGKRSEPYIFNALDKAKALIVYGSRAEYFESTWVRNEWQRYLRAMEKGKKPKDSLILVYDGFNPKTLPQGLRGIQGIDYRSKTSYQEILNVLGRIFVSAAEIAPTIERINIEAGKVGKRAATAGERIATVALGTEVAPKGAAAKRTMLPVYTRELGVSARIPDKVQDNKFTAALACLRAGAFEQAKSFFDSCLHDNDKNGDLWLGKLCADLKDDKFYDEIKGNTPSVSHSVKVIQDYVVLQNSIDYAADKPTAERLLSFVYEQLETRVCQKSISPGDAETVYNLYKLCGDYNSENAKRMLRILSQNADKLAAADASNLLDYLFERISDIDELIFALEIAADTYLQKKSFDKARRYNDRLIRLDETNGKALLNAFYIENRYAGKKELIDARVPGKNFSGIEKGLSKVSRADAEKIIAILCEAEKAFMRRQQLGDAEAYFTFIVKYDFPGRDDFLRAHADLWKPFIGNKVAVGFYEKWLAVYPDRSADFHIENRLAFADGLRQNADFRQAEEMYKKTLELDSENLRALQGTFFCSLRYSEEKNNDVQWQNWDQKLFERVLAVCPNKKAQSDLVNKMCRLCIDSVKKMPPVADKGAADVVRDTARRVDSSRKNADSPHEQDKLCFVIESGVLKEYKGTDKDVIIPDGVTSIADSAFEGSVGLKSITIPKGVIRIDSGAFEGCSELERLTVLSGNKMYHSDGNCLIETATKILVQGCKNSKIPADGSVTYVGNNAFEGCKGLKNIIIPNGVTGIGDLAFSCCDGLISAILPRSITTIGVSAFAGCGGLTSITLPEGITIIGSGAFSSCNGLTGIIIPSSVTKIGGWAFFGCNGLTGIIIPKSVVEIGTNVFDDCSKVTIYAQTVSKPQGWNSLWNPDNRPVIWGYKG